MEDLEKVTGWFVRVLDNNKPLQGRLAPNEVKIVMLDGWRLHKLNSKKFSPNARLLTCEALYD
jgi:hypothetical protein